MTDVSALGYIAKSAGEKNLELTGQLSQPSGARFLGVRTTIASGATLTAAQCLADLIETTGNTGNVTTATAALILAAMDEVTSGTMWRTYFHNPTAGQVITLAAGVGVTVDGTAAVAAQRIVTLLWRVTDHTDDVATITVYVSHSA